ncbi:MAG TPA: FAD-dependent oxidoreductase [Mycobacteriales bacterium]|jgi:ferredoxin--NADP+ reductase|nr:FAD-dependent oxidoreductase [Mycobacteriales bacterium]
MRRVAVVGSGPAGVYAAAGLLAHGDVAIDVFDRLPCPYGLVRYGVAPDHVKMKQVSLALQKVLENPAVRFLGNVEVGADLTVADLQRHYDAFVMCQGAAVARGLGIPGEDLPGSLSATDFVAWYSGHPDAQIPLADGRLDARGVAIVGVGNVAVDLARVLAKTADELAYTDLPDDVLDVLRGSAVTDIHIVGRRSAAHAKFTTKELRELGDLPNADVLVDPADLVLDESGQQIVAAEPVRARNLEVLREWSERTPEGRPRRIHVRFLHRPVEVVGDDRVIGLVLERTSIDETGTAVGTGETLTVEADLVLRSVGYRGVAFPGLPFDERRGIVPNEGGRVVRDGAPVPGQYVAGWIKRGPTGVIGTNKHDAQESITALLADLPSLPVAPESDPDAVIAVLESRGVQVVVWDGWREIDAAEAELGKAQGRKRVKISDRSTLLQTAARSAGQGRVVDGTDRSAAAASRAADSRSRVSAAARESAGDGAVAP